MQKIRVRAVGTVLATNFDALDNGIRRFLGRRIDAAAGGFVPLDEPDEVSARPEHVQEVREGSVEVCDAESAAICNVPWKAPNVTKKAKES